MKARIVPIGNSQGIRIPKALLQQTGLNGSVEIVAEGGTLRIRKAAHPREGWAEACRDMTARGDDKPLDRYVPGKFDKEQWEWT